MHELIAKLGSSRTDLIEMPVLAKLSANADMRHLPARAILGRKSIEASHPCELPVEFGTSLSQGCQPSEAVSLVGHVSLVGRVSRLAA